MFSDVSIESGIIGPVGVMGQTSAWGDFNKDGFQDLVAGNANTGGRAQYIFFFENNRDGSFSDVTEGSGVLNLRTRNSAWADYGNDGLPDLVVGTTRTLVPPILYRNLGEGIFVDSSEEAGITKEGGAVNHAIWADFDRDGLVDLLQVNNTNSVRSFLYHNNGDGTFDEVSDIIDFGEFITNSAVWFDYNNDGFPDLFLANRGLNTLYLNNGDFTFTDITDKAGVGGDPNWNSVAVCVGDFNNDSFLDLYVTNILSKTLVRNALYRNNGDGTFTDVTEETGTGDVGDGRTCAWVDFDGDGWIDLFTTNHVNPSKLFRNMGNGKFVDVAAEVGLKSKIDVFAAPWGDYNNDGFMDVFLIGHFGAGLMENRGNQNNFIILSLVGNGITTNRSAIGARVEVTTLTGTQIREVSGGRGCCEQDMLPVHFGVGNDGLADILIKWTDGGECFFESIDVGGGRLFQISEDGCNLREF